MEGKAVVLHMYVQRPLSMMREEAALDWLSLCCADVTPRKAMEGKAVVLYDFQGADDQELTVFEGQEVPILRLPGADFLFANTKPGFCAAAQNVAQQGSSHATMKGRTPHISPCSRRCSMSRMAE